jgi:translocation and assembly module TamB
MLSPSLQRASGTLRANLDIGGSWKRPTIGGAVAVNNGDVSLQNLGIRARGIDGRIDFNGPRDSLTINLRAWSGSGVADRLSLTGYISYANRQEPRFDLKLYARNFHALDRRSLASLDVSTGADSLRLSGAFRAATLAGTITVGRGTIYLPERDLARKQIVDLTGADLFALLDTTDSRNRRIVPDAPSELVANLRLGGVRINIGDEVWLRSREANVKLGGSLSVTSAAEDARTAASRRGRTDAPIYRLALEGQLNAERGSYTLDLAPAPVQREFQVQRGTMTFFGTADNNPYVDITATHNVKRASQSDLSIVVRLVGPLTPYPTIDLTSSEPYLSKSDLVSYLITGQPTFALGAAGQNIVNQVASVVLPSITTSLTQELRSRVGSWVDLFQFQGGALSSEQDKLYGTKSIQDYFYGARLGGEKQISNNLFFSFSAGLCSLNRQYVQDNYQNALAGFVDALSGKLEYRFNPQLSVQAGSEPGTSQLYCGRSTAFQTLVPTPRQLGFSLLRTWHF